MSDWNELGKRLMASLPPELLDPPPRLAGKPVIGVGEPLAVTKFGATVAVPPELLFDAGVIEPTPAERVEAERRAVERAAKLAAARQQLAAVTDPLARAVLDLHSEDEHGDCGGCDFSGYEAEPPGWPCSTVELVAARYGIELP